MPPIRDEEIAHAPQPHLSKRLRVQTRCPPIGERCPSMAGCVRSPLGPSRMLRSVHVQIRHTHSCRFNVTRGNWPSFAGERFGLHSIIVAGWRPNVRQPIWHETSAAESGSERVGRKRRVHRFAVCTRTASNTFSRLTVRLAVTPAIFDGDQAASLSKSARKSAVGR
jgi:hypothetical protein